MYCSGRDVRSRVIYGPRRCPRWRVVGKRLGPCEHLEVIVLQERAGEAVLLAVAFDADVIGPDGETELTVVIELGG